MQPVWPSTPLSLSLIAVTPPTSQVRPTSSPAMFTQLSAFVRSSLLPWRPACVTSNGAWPPIGVGSPALETSVLFTVFFFFGDKSQFRTGGWNASKPPSAVEQRRALSETSPPLLIFQSLSGDQYRGPALL